MSQAAAAPAAPVVQMIPLADIHESKSNPRKTFSGIEELAEDLKVRGLLQPVLVRGNADGYELVFGARRYRAAKLAKLSALPAFVRELNDEQTLELQIVENTQRADVHPLEEADGYRRLHEEFKYSVEEIAAKVGKSRSAVYERIKLCALTPAAREAFFAAKLSASTALLVARIPDKELQAKAVKDLVGRAGDDPMSYREAVDHVQRNYMLQLKDAPFSTTDATLVAKAGACAACPKRTGNQRELFADVKSPDVCTDPKCYAGKVDALWQIRVEKAKDTGQEVLDEKKSKELFQYGQLGYNAEYQDLADKVYVGNGEKSVKSIVGKEAPTVLARNPRTGEIHELVKRDLVRKASKEKAPEHKPSKADLASQERFRRENEKHKKQQEQQGAIAKAIHAVVVERAERSDLKPAAWKFLAACFAHRDNFDFVEQLVERRGWVKEEDGYDPEVARKEVEKLTGDQARGFVVEAILDLNGYYGAERIDRLKEASKVFGVDYDKLVAVATGKKPPEKKAAPRGQMAKVHAKLATAKARRAVAAAKKKPGKKK